MVDTGAVGVFIGKDTGWAIYLSVYQNGHYGKK